MQGSSSVGESWFGSCSLGELRCEGDVVWGSCNQAVVGTGKKILAAGLWHLLPDWSQIKTQGKTKVVYCEVSNLKNVKVNDQLKFVSKGKIIN